MPQGRLHHCIHRIWCHANIPIQYMKAHQSPVKAVLSIFIALGSLGGPQTKAVILGQCAVEDLSSSLMSDFALFSSAWQPLPLRATYTYSSLTVASSTRSHSVTLSWGMDKVCYPRCHHLPIKCVWRKFDHEGPSFVLMAVDMFPLF